MVRRPLQRASSNMIHGEPGSPDNELISTEQVQQQALKAGLFRAGRSTLDNLLPNLNNGDGDDESQPTTVSQSTKTKRKAARLARNGSFRSLQTTDSVRLTKSQIYKSSQQMTLLELLSRGARGKAKQGKCCLKKAGEDSSPKEKSVSFATNAFNDRVWSTVIPIDKLSREGNDNNGSTLDGIRRDELWWTEQELQNIRIQLLDIVTKCSPDYSDKLERAYLSSGLAPSYSFEPATSSSSTQEEEYGSVPPSFELCKKTVAKYSHARGLENVINPVLDDFKMAHRTAILETQKLLKGDRPQRRRRRRRKSGSHHVPSKAFYEDIDLDWEIIRTQSLERSRACRYVSLALGEMDQEQAKPLNRKPKSRKLPRRRNSSMKNLVVV